MIVQKISESKYCTLNKISKFKYNHSVGTIKTTIQYTDISSDVFGPLDSFNHENEYDDKKKHQPCPKFFIYEK